MIGRTEFANPSPEHEPPVASIPCPWPYGCDQLAVAVEPTVYECPEHGRIHVNGGDAA